MTGTVAAPLEVPLSNDIEPMWHVTLDGRPDVALCGARLDGDSEDGGLFIHAGADCAVCADLALAFIDGRWTP